MHAIEDNLLPKVHPLQTLADQLEADIRAVYSSDQTPSEIGVQPMAECFARFGELAAQANITLEDTMSVSVNALQHTLEHFRDDFAEPSTVLAAGIALAAVSRAHGSSMAESMERGKQQQAQLPTQIARLTALHEINRAATANLKLSETLSTTVHVVANAVSADGCAIFLHDEATDLLALWAAVGLSPAAVGAMTIRMTTGITGQAARNREIIAAPDAHMHPAFESDSGIGDQVYASQVSVPILIQSRLVGVLNIYSVQRRELDDGVLAFLETVASELAVAINNARQYSSTDERLQRKVSELGTLQRVSRTLTSTLNLPDVLRLIAEQAVELMHAASAAIFRLPQSGKKGSDHPVIAYRAGPERHMVDSQQLDEIVSSVLSSGAARSASMEYVDGQDRVFCLPLRTARETVGALCFRLPMTVELDEDSLGVLQAFSDTAAIAIENAQLYDDAMQSLHTQSALVQEMHHRVRNNLQTVAALLSLQLRTAEDSPWAFEIREAISRIQSIAAVHDLLSDEERLAGTTVDVIARMVAEDAHSTLIPPGTKVKFSIPPSDLTVPSRQATILSLLINELTANAISHGFKGREHGYIRIRAWNDDEVAHVEVFNDGNGVPSGFDPAQSDGLGMRITQRLVTSDLRGEFSIASDEDGTTAQIRFPIADDEPLDQPVL